MFYAMEYLLGGKQGYHNSGSILSSTFWGSLGHLFNDQGSKVSLLCLPSMLRYLSILFGISFWVWLSSASPVSPQLSHLRESWNVSQKVAGIWVTHRIFTQQAYNSLCSSDKYHNISLPSALSKQYYLSKYWKQWIKALLLATVHAILGRNTNFMYKGSWKKTHISQQDF